MWPAMPHTASMRQDKRRGMPHDPKPLYYQFSFERAGTFTWAYLEEGPEVWRVEIGKT